MIQKSLGRMGMPAVTGIDDVDVIQPVLVQVPGDQKGGAGLGMADDEHVGMHRRQIGRRCRARDSPLLVDEEAMFRLMTSAESRLAAISRSSVSGSNSRRKD